MDVYGFFYANIVGDRRPFFKCQSDIQGTNKQKKTSDEIKLSDRQWSCTSRHSELRIPYCYFKLNITNTLLCITLYLPILNSDVVK